jgi:hypothetical protein
MPVATLAERRADARGPGEVSLAPGAAIAGRSHRAFSASNIGQGQIFSQYFARCMKRVAEQLNGG